MLASLTHPHIAAIYGLEEFEGKQLLVLELAVPTVSGDFGRNLVDEGVSYVAYLAAFANIGVLWMGHHTVFTRIAAVDSGLLWRNLVLLLTVSVVPFPTAVLAEYIATQEEHHRRRTFSEELKLFVERYELEWHADENR